MNQVEEGPDERGPAVTGGAPFNVRRYQTLR